MKPIRIAYRRDSMPLAPWLLVAVCVACMGAFFSVRWSERRLSTSETQASTTSARERAAHLKSLALKPVERPPAHVAELLSRLGVDLNPVFASVENADIPGVRLVHLAVDESSSATIEYELAEIGDVVTVGNTLNAGYRVPPWKLQSVAGSPRGQQQLGPDRKRAQWKASLAELGRP